MRALDMAAYELRAAGFRTEQHVVNVLFEPRGAAIDGGGGVDIDHLGLDTPGMGREQQDPIADLDRLGDRMRHEQDGEARLVPELHQLVLAGAPGEGVERGKGLIHQQYVRLHRHAARNRDALLHAARQAYAGSCRARGSG